MDWGAGPRASQYLVLGAKARAAMAGRPMADLDDVRAVAPAVLRHRLVTNFAAEAADRTSEDLVRELVGGKGWLGGDDRGTEGPAGMRRPGLRTVTGVTPGLELAQSGSHQLAEGHQRHLVVVQDRLEGLLLVRRQRLRRRRR